MALLLYFFTLAAVASLACFLAVSVLSLNSLRCCLVLAPPPLTEPLRGEAVNF